MLAKMLAVPTQRAIQASGELAVRTGTVGKGICIGVLLSLTPTVARDIVSVQYILQVSVIP